MVCNIPVKVSSILQKGGESVMRTLNMMAFIMILAMLFVGCSTINEDQLIEFTIAKRIAEEALTIDERSTVLPWKREIVTPISVERVPSYIDTKDLSTDAKIYKVEIQTSKDEIVGPIDIYVDVVSETVIGRQLRN